MALDDTRKGHLSRETRQCCWLDPRLRFHDLRHTAASIAGSRQYAGEAAKVVQQLLRHSTQQVTTEVYMHLFPEDMERLREGLNRVYEEASRVAVMGDGMIPDTKRETTVTSLAARRLLVQAEADDSYLLSDGESRTLGLSSMIVSSRRHTITSTA